MVRLTGIDGCVKSCTAHDEHIRVMSVMCGMLCIDSHDVAGWFVHRLREAATASANVTLRLGTVKQLLNGEAAAVVINFMANRRRSVLLRATRFVPTAVCFI